MNRARVLAVAAEFALKSAEEMNISETNSASVLRESYEALRMFCEAIGYKSGFKFNSHEVITEFLTEELNERRIAVRFDNYRKLRNGANYYGKEISLEDAEECRKEVRRMLLCLGKYLT